MTPEEKQLLLVDLCGRIPYGVKVQFECWDEQTEDYIEVVDTLYSVNSDEWVNVSETDSEIIIEGVKPYLFPKSSMTVEQRDSYRFLASSAYASPVGLINFYHKNHIDYRGLIPKGLAEDATGLNIY